MIKKLSKKHYAETTTTNASTHARSRKSVKVRTEKMARERERERNSFHRSLRGGRGRERIITQRTDIGREGGKIFYTKTGKK